MSSARNTKPLPLTFIYKEVVNRRVKNFQDNKLPLLTNAIGKPDSKSGWYSLEQLEELMRELYYQNADGVRIYFAAHEPDDPEFANQLTVIFVPTYLDVLTGDHKDVIIDDDVDFEKRADSELESKTRVIEKGLDTIALCPPSCSSQGIEYPY